jgi:Gram-negative bacterial TonB protein C-terminal
LGFFLLLVLVPGPAANRAQDKGTSVEQNHSAISSPTPKRITVDTKTMSSRLTRVVTPQYPAVAKKKNIQGTLKLRAIVAIDGFVKELTAISDDPILIAPARTAVKQRQYKPTLVNNDPAEVETIVVVIFELPK